MKSTARGTLLWLERLDSTLVSYEFSYESAIPAASFGERNTISLVATNKQTPASPPVCYSLNYVQY